MRITSSVEYATRLMTALAREHAGAPVSAEKLAGADNIPADYVSQLLVKLRRAGLVESRRGSSGGYALAKAPGVIKLCDIVRAVDGEVFEDVCGKYEKGTKDCRHQGDCSISPVWKRLGAMVTQYFDSVTLGDILEERPGRCGGAAAAFLEKALK